MLICPVVILVSAVFRVIMITTTTTDDLSGGRTYLCGVIYSCLHFKVKVYERLSTFIPSNKHGCSVSDTNLREQVFVCDCTSGRI